MATGGFVGFAPSARGNGDAGANSIFLTAVVAPQSGTATAVLLDCFNLTPGTTFRALVYDSAHSVLLASSNIFTSSTAGYNRFALTSPLTLVAGTTYYVGYVCSTSFSVSIQTGGGTSWFAGGGQNVTTPPNPLAAGASNTNALMIALELDGSGSSGQGWGTDQASGVTLSSANALATFSTTATRGARSTVTRSSGLFKWYAEVVVGGTINNNVGVGIASGNWGVTQGTAGALSYVQWLLPTGSLQSSSGTTALGLTYVSGDTIGIAYDGFNNLLWFNKNNGSWFGASSTAGNPVTGTGGAVVSNTTWPVAVTVATGATGVAATFNLHDLSTNQTYTPPSGFTAWGTPVPTQLNVQGLVRETVVSGVGVIEAQGLVRESVVTGPGIVYASGMAREALVSDVGQVLESGLAREALIAGVGLLASIGGQSGLAGTTSAVAAVTNVQGYISSASGLSAVLRVTLNLSAQIGTRSNASAAASLTATVLLGGGVRAQSGISANLTTTSSGILFSELKGTSGITAGPPRLTITLRGQIGGQSGISLILPTNDMSKLVGYTVLGRASISLGNLNSYVVLSVPSIEVSKLNSYVVMNTRTDADMASLNAYVVLGFPPSIQMSQAKAYVVLGHPPGQDLTKVNSYAVLKAQVGTGTEFLKPYFVIIPS